MVSISRRLALAAPLLGFIASKTRALAQSPLKNPAASATGPGKAPDTDWLHYAGDVKSTRYSPIDQIGPDNFNRLEVAWRFQTSPYGPKPEFELQCTPLVSKGRMFFTAGSRRDVVSIDAATGEVLWVYRKEEGERASKAPRLLSGRGLAYAIEIERTLSGEWAVVRSWGRIGTHGRQLESWFPESDAAIASAAHLEATKRRRGYREATC